MTSRGVRSMGRGRILLVSEERVNDITDGDHDHHHSIELHYSHPLVLLDYFSFVEGVKKLLNILAEFLQWSKSTEFLIDCPVILINQRLISYPLIELINWTTRHPSAGPR